MARKSKIRQANQIIEVQIDPPMPEAEQSPLSLIFYCIIEEKSEKLLIPIFQWNQNNKEDFFTKELYTFIYKHKLSNHCIDDLLKF